MINRLALLKLANNADAAVMAQIREYVSRIREEVMETRSYHLAPNNAAELDGYNWVLHSSFETEADMNAYRSNALHIEFVKYCDQYTEAFLPVFYDAPPD